MREYLVITIHVKIRHDCEFLRANCQKSVMASHGNPPRDYIGPRLQSLQVHIFFFLYITILLKAI